MRPEGPILCRRNLRVVHAPADSETYDANVVVGIAVCYPSDGLGHCIDSVRRQERDGRLVAIVVLVDVAAGEPDCFDDLVDRFPDVHIVAARCGCAARARNAILDYVDHAFTRACWVARLDHDDEFAETRSLIEACRFAESSGADFLVGSNGLRDADGAPMGLNLAITNLLDTDFVVGRLRDMANYTAENELPSCNLLMRTRMGWRYPDERSAEDHWLVASLLIHHADRGCIMREPLFANYTLQGAATINARRNGHHTDSRRRLHQAATTWAEAQRETLRILGFGSEGIVVVDGNEVQKHFYDTRLTLETADWMVRTLSQAGPYFPLVSYSFVGGKLHLKYPAFASQPVESISRIEARDFLVHCLRHSIACTNVKRSNFRRRNGGQLVFTDIGVDVRPMDVAYFVDSAARMYAASLGWSDDELKRRPQAIMSQEEAFSELPEFESFYKEVVTAWLEPALCRDELSDPVPLPPADDTTLLMRFCAMDTEHIEAQVWHLVSTLSRPRPFAAVVIVIDPYTGPFQRGYSPGNLNDLIDKAEAFKKAGVIDGVWVSPNDKETARTLNVRWFAVNSEHTHTWPKGTNPKSPQPGPGTSITSQLWSFEQVTTRYLLQCDGDILVGRRDSSHDYLTDMRDVLKRNADALCISMNIPHAANSPVQDYGAPPGDYAPEVRCGLLDLQRLEACLPIENPTSNGRLLLGWHRALHQHQRKTGQRTLRGGDPATFYVHPPNTWKTSPDLLGRIRDLVSQGHVPECQHESWDIVGTAKDWRYAPRREPVVFLVKGRNTPVVQMARCLQSLKDQDDQNFGVVLIDDASEGDFPFLLPAMLGELKPRTTLVRHSTRQGRIPNFCLGITEICADPGTLIVILDADDALAVATVVRDLRGWHGAGHDVILGAMYRPDKPCRTYKPNFDDPRGKEGGDVWIHLRAFEKRLFDQVPLDALMHNGDWLPQCTDYATMLPIVELSRSPVYIPRYLYFHDRSTPNTPAIRAEKNALIAAILSKPRLSSDAPNSTTEH